MTSLRLAALLLVLAFTHIAAAEPPIDEDALPDGAIARLGSRERYYDSNHGSIFTIVDGGRTLVTVHDGPQVFYRDVASGKLLHVKVLGSDDKSTLGLSADGRTLATSDGKFIEIWDLASQRVVRKIAWKDGNNANFRLTADGSRFVRFQGETIEVWDVKSGRGYTITPHNGQFKFEGLVLNDRAFLIRHEKQMRCHELETGRMLWSSDEFADSNVWRVLPGGLLAWYVSDSKWSLIELATGKRSQLHPHRDADPVIGPSNHADMVYERLQSGLRIRNLYTGRIKGEIPDVSQEFGVTPNGQYLLGSDKEKRLQCWHIATGRPRYARPKAEAHDAPVRSMIFRPDGQTLLSVGGTRAILWDLNSRQPRRVLDYSTLEGNPWVFSTPDGSRLVRLFWNDPDGKWDILDVNQPGNRTPGNTPILLKNDDLTTCIHITSGARSFLMDTAEEQEGGIDRHRLIARDLPSGKVLWNRDEFAPRGFACFAPDGSLYARLSGGVYETRTGRLRMPLALGTLNAWESVFIHDLTRVAVLQIGESGDSPKSGKEDGVYLYEIPTGQTVFLPSGAAGQIQLTPDGRRLVVASHEYVHVWDTAARRELQRWKVLRPGHPVPGGDYCATSTAISRDGKILATGHQDGTILLWNMPPTPRTERVTAVDHDSLWSDLAGNDAAKAWLAIARLADSPAEGLTLFKARLRPTMPPPTERVNALLAALAAPEFARREDAGKQLAAMSDLVEPALRSALATSSSPEQRKRLKHLLDLPLMLRDPERIRRWRAVAALEQIGTAEARKLLALVAESPAGCVEEQAARAAMQRLNKGLGK